MRKLITKYFCEGAEQYMRAGSFKFGTLVGYRGGEGLPSAARMSDGREGVIQEGFHPPGGRIDYFEDSRGNRIMDCTSDGCAVPIMVSTPFNEYVFCATNSDYDPVHHLAMRDGCPLTLPAGHYAGNADLTHYAVIDLERFIEAAHSIARARVGWAAAYLDVHKVRYEDPTYSRPIPSTYRYQNRPPNEAYLKSLYYKPKRFLPEREIRLVLKLPGGIAHDSIDPLILEGEALGRSVVRIGTMA